MFSTFFKFETKQWLRSPMLYIFLFIFTLLVFGATASDNIQIGGSTGNVHKNAPQTILQFYGIMSLLTMLLKTAFMNSAAIRDFENNTQQIIFSTPLSKAGYFFGHWAGAILAACLPLIGVSLGVLLGSVCSLAFDWQDAERFGPVYWGAHLNGFLIFVIPNTIFCGSIIYGIAALTRNTILSYIASLALLIAYIASGTLLSDMKNETLAAMLDPFGIRTISIVTKYWTVDEKNTVIMGLQGVLLMNRLLWIGVGLLILCLCYWRFSFSEKAKKGAKETKEEDHLGLAQLANLPTVTQNFGSTTTRSQLWSQYKTNLKGIVRSTPFILLSIIGMANLLPSLLSSNAGYGVTTFPVTYQMADTIIGSFYLFVISVLTYFSGMLIWKERDAKVDEIYDALPTLTWTSYVAKYFALATTVFLMLTIAIVTCIFTQTIKGYHNYELDVYVQRIYLIDFIGFMILLAAFMLIHVLVNNKYIGFFACIMFIILNVFVWQAVHVRSNMVIFGSLPSQTYSDMARFGPYVAPLSNFSIYWSLFALILGFFTVAFWVRGKETTWRNRFKNFRFNVSKSKGLAFGLVGIWAVCASWVFYNTKVLNTYKVDNEVEMLKVDYEKLYKKYENTKTLSYSSLKYNIDIFPEERRLATKIEVVLKNNQNRPIDTVMFSFEGTNITYDLKIDNATEIISDKAHGFTMYKLNQPLAIGDSVQMHVTSQYAAKGFENEVSFTKIVQNGSFFDNSDIAPIIGYQGSQELNDRNKRKKYGLGDPSMMPNLEENCTDNCMKTYLGGLDSWVDVETTISTSEDQIAIAPGSLVREWKEGNRRYFNYKLDQRSANFYSFISARYEVSRRKVNGVDIEVYYHKGHPYNVERMSKAIEKSLAYYTENFGPYFHKQCRIIEFPRYGSFAQAFPGTMPYSEGIGFIENLESPTDIDMATYIVAHEIGHQYWAHQVVGANMKGGTLLSETFAQYSALMVMEKTHGRDMMRKFLKYETDRYLRSRGSERLKEQPLYKVEMSQGYIHYQKGSSVMYYLKEMIGEDKLNLSLRTFLEKYRYAAPPYPTSLDVLSEFRKNTPDSLQYIIKDLFEDITLFNNRTTEATYTKLTEGKYAVTIKTESQKFKANEMGKETEVPMNDYIEIGALAKAEKDKQPKILYRQRVKITQKKNEFTFIVDELPEEAGIDHMFQLIDRMPNDNVKQVTIETIQGRTNLLR
jgi:ABC-2 type transport system permease protein